MTDAQQPSDDDLKIQELINTFMSASPQEERDLIVANPNVLLSGDIISSLRDYISALEQKLSLLEEAQKDYAHEQVHSHNTNQQVQENPSQEQSSDDQPEAKTAESHTAPQEQSPIHAQQEPSYTEMNIPQQPYIPRSEAETEAMLASMTSKQFEQVIQMLGNLSDAEVTQLLQMMGRSEQLGGMQLNVLRSVFQQYRDMGQEGIQQIAEQIKAFSPEQIHTAKDTFKATAQNIGDAQIEQVEQRFRNLSPQELEALLEDLVKQGQIDEGQKDMMRLSLQQLQAAGGNQVKDLLDTVLKAQLTGEPVDTKRLQELQIPLMQNALRATQEPEQAIEAYTRELATLSREQNPFHWARLHYQRGVAYRMSTAQDQSANLERALADFNAALTVFTPENSAAEWGTILMIRASVYLDRKLGHFAENRQQAVVDCEAAMHIFPRETFPKEWASAKLTRAVAYNTLAHYTGDTGTLLENAILDCDDALSVFTHQRYPEEWTHAMTMRCLAHSQCGTGNLQQHREQVIADANAALKIISREQFPDDWAAIHSYRALAYWHRVAGDKQHNLDQAMTDYETALTVYTMPAYPEQRAAILNNRAMIRMELGHGDLRDHIEQSIKDMLGTLKVLQKETQPVEWATAHLSCAVLYLKRMAEDHRQNWQTAYVHCNRALEVFNKEQTPLFWGQALVRRGTARYGDLPKELPQVLENRLGLMQLVEHGPQYMFQRLKSSYEIYRAAYDDFDKALTVLTRENAPTEWALAHSARAQAYAIMNLENSQAYTEQANKDFAMAQTVFTPESMPFEWAGMQAEQALMLLLSPTNQSPEAIKQQAQKALQHIDAALQVYTAEVSIMNYQYIRVLQAIAYERLSNWEEAHKSWLEVRKVRRTLMAMALSEQSRTDQEIVLMNFNIYKHDAQVLLRCSPPDVAEAVIALEEGRAQGLRLALDLDSVDPQKEQSQQAKKRAEALLAARKVWQQCQQQVELLLKEKNIAEVSEERHRCMQELQRAQEGFIQAGNAIRAYDNPDFMSPVPTLASIAGAISEPGDALIYLVAGSYFGLGITDNVLGAGADKGMAIIVTRDVQGEPHVHPLDLPLLTGLAIDGLYDPEKTSDSNVDRVIKQAGEAGHERSGCDTTPMGCAQNNVYSLWTLEPVPTCSYPGPAFQWGEAYLGDLFEVNVAPSARACEISAQRAREAARNRQRQGLCLVGNPFPLAGASSDDHIPSELPQAEAEVDIIRQIARAYGYPAARIQHVSRREATKQRVVEGLLIAQYAHLAMHGTYKVARPLESRLILAGSRNVPEQDRSIKLSEILQGAISLSGLRLLVLSACDTSLIDLRRVPDEVIGLAAGFLQAGVAGVIASLWRVDDTATYLLMARFARYYLDPQGIWSPVRALTEAQRWLRQEATNRVLASYDPLEGMIDPSRLPEEAQKLYNKTVTKIRKQAEKQLETAADVCPYGDPRYWAAFIVTGC